MRASLPVVALLLAACGGSTSPSAADATDTVEAPDTAETPDTADTSDGATVIPPSDAPTSQELIHRALVEGVLDEDTALVYRVFAAFSDERLPMPYRGQRAHDPLVGAELVSRYTALSPEHRAAVYPFTRPPPAHDSWYALRSGASEAPAEISPNLRDAPPCTEPFASQTPWVPLDAEHFRVWYAQHGDHEPVAQVAADVLEEIEQYLWPLLTELLGTEPLGDAGMNCNGGDARLDVYVLPELEVYPATMIMPYPIDCHQARPVFLIVGPESSRQSLMAVVAHELFHALQLSYPTLGLCHEQIGGPIWALEGTAVWAESQAYPERGISLRWTVDHGMFATPFEGLSSETAPNKRYRSFPFWYHLVARHQDSDLIRQFYEQLDVVSWHGDALAEIAPRGLTLDYLDFAIHLLNEPPERSWENWIGLRGQPTIHAVRPSLAGRGALSTPIEPLEVDAFGVRYWHIEPEDDARLLFFDNPVAEMQVPGLKLHAVRKLADGTLAAPLDWTAIDTPVLCRDDPSDDFASLYLLMTWADPKEVHGRVTTPRPGRLVVAATPCHALTGHSDVSIAMNEQVGAFSVSTEEKISASFSFTRAAIDAEGGQVAIELVPSGSLTWSMSSSVVAASDPPFSASCPAGPVDANILHEHGTLGFVIDKDGQALWFANGRIPIGPLPWTDCFGEASTMTSEPYWLYVGDQLLPFEGAASLSGAFRRDGLDASWRFTR